MKRDMKKWLKEWQAAPVKKAFPILSFPAVQLMGISVKDLIGDAGLQARGMKLVAQQTDSAASVSLMDLSVEAECFGAKIRFSEDEVPTVVQSVVSTEEEAEALIVPPVGSGRTGIYLDAIRQAAEEITDRPVFAGVIGPYSLAGRLMDVTEIMILCYEEPDMVHTVLRKATRFLIDYCKAYKECGANGVVIAEPLAGVLSPTLEEEFSEPYTREIVESVQDDSFAVIYHNCGNGTAMMTASIAATGAAAFHFGNAVDMEEMLQKMPKDKLVMGNIDPAGQFRNGTPESIRKETLALMERCCRYDNFVISSGCDIPPMSRWENVRAFFGAVKDFYEMNEKHAEGYKYE
ncbi:MAG: methyltransferase [Lachnospiraceae bacterium]|jgi:uroporphyrinogen decarboxylase|nr:methyltransferase [Lachnospiraceae bacterium]